MKEDVVFAVLMWERPLAEFKYFIKLFPVSKGKSWLIRGKHMSDVTMQIHSDCNNNNINNNNNNSGLL